VQGQKSDESEEQLVEAMADFQHDPYGFILFVFPWGEVGTALEEYDGPRKWQKDFLVKLGNKLRGGEDLHIVIAEAIDEVIQMAVASGHGIGKSALVAWIILWALSTFEDTKGIVTANTDTQLRTKTWPELAKWYGMSINKHWFKYEATSIHSVQKGHERTWRIDMIPWSDKNPEAFAGLHNKGKRILLIFDEASAIHDKIWEVSEGALTDEDTEIIWCCFGNPTRNMGRFRECFRRLKHRWERWQIDSREVDGTNKKQLQKWVDDYGVNSDFVRVRVRGRFPTLANMQFISSSVIHDAMHVEARSNIGDPLIMTLDIARGGDDECVIAFKRGLDGRAIEMTRIPGTESRDSMKLATLTVGKLEHHKPDAFFFDGVGVGGPVGDRIKQLGFHPMEVKGSNSSPDPKYGNMRAYMYSKLRDWLEAGGAIPDDPELEEQLTSIEYFHDKNDKIKLVSKDDMKALGLPSPDMADSYSMMFAAPVAPVKGIGAAGRNSDIVEDFEPEYG